MKENNGDRQIRRSGEANESKIHYQKGSKH